MQQVVRLAAFFCAYKSYRVADSQGPPITPNHQNVLFQASFPCDITQQPVVWAEKSQGNRGLR